MGIIKELMNRRLYRYGIDYYLYYWELIIKKSKMYQILILLMLITSTVSFF